MKTLNTVNDPQEYKNIVLNYSRDFEKVTHITKAQVEQLPAPTIQYYADWTLASLTRAKETISNVLAAREMAKMTGDEDVLEWQHKLFAWEWFKNGWSYGRPSLSAKTRSDLCPLEFCGEGDRKAYQKQAYFYDEFIGDINPEAFFQFKMLPNNTYEIMAIDKHKIPAKITVPKSYKGIPITSIGEDAFAGCAFLKSVTILNGINNIGENAFYGCAALKEVEIPDSVTSMGICAFRDCVSLKEIDIPSGIKNITGAFYGCRSLIKVVLHNGLESIGDSAFKDCSALEHIQIPDSVSILGRSAFSGCSALEIVSIPIGVKEIQIFAYSGCSSLRRVYYYGTIAQWELIERGRDYDPQGPYIEGENYPLIFVQDHK